VRKACPPLPLVCPLWKFQSLGAQLIQETSYIYDGFAVDDTFWPHILHIWWFCSGWYILASQSHLGSSPSISDDTLFLCFWGQGKDEVNTCKQEPGFPNVVVITFA
jgi:hypothetical protein